MRSNPSAMTALLAVCAWAMVTSSSRAENVLPVTATEPVASSRTGVPTLPDVLWPMHWLHTDPNDPARSTGIGGPLKGTSWRNRPFHIGWMVGGLIGDRLIEGAVDQKAALMGGYRLGWDFDFPTAKAASFGDRHHHAVYSRSAEKSPVSLAE